MSAITVLGILIIAAAAGLWRQELPIFIAITLWIGIPTIASQEVTHLSSGFHPSSIIIVATFIMQMLSGKLTPVWYGHLTGLVAAGSFVVADAYLDTAFSAGRKVLLSAAVVNQILAPFLLFLLICFYCGQHSNGLARLRNLLLVIATAEAVYSVPQGTQIKGGNASSIPFASSYAKQYWFPALDRALGTTDHPLVLGLLLASCIPLVASLQSSLLQVGISVTLLFGVISASDRAASIVATLAIAYVLVRAGGSTIVRLTRLAVASTFLGVVLVLPVGQSILRRLNSIGSTDPSTQLRVDAYGYFFDHWTGNIFTGGGVGSTSNLGSTGVLGSSFENPVLINVFEIGLIATLVLTASQIYVLWRGHQYTATVGVSAAAILCLVVSVPFNSTTSASACSPILWTFLGLAYSGALGGSDGRTPSTSESFGGRSGQAFAKELPSPLPRRRALLGSPGRSG